MRTQRVFEITECAELSRVVPAKPPGGVAVVAGTLLALVAMAIAWAALTEADLVVRAPGRVRARTAPAVAYTASAGDRAVAAIAGRVAKVLVREGSIVRAGDPLAVLDTTQLGNDVARLEGAVTAARDAREASQRIAELAASQHEAAQAARRAELAQVERDEWRGRARRGADIELARNALGAAVREEARVRGLVGDGAAAQSQLDAATAKVAERRAELTAAEVIAAGGRAEVLRKQIDLAEREHAVRRAELAQQVSRQTAELAAAEHQAANARFELAAGTIRAETSGVVGAVAVAVGDVVQPGRELFSIAPDCGLRIDAAVGVADVGRLRIGMPVRIRLDAFDWQRYGTLTGTIEQLSADASPIAANGQLVYTARIALDRDEVGDGDVRGKLRLGMTGMVEVITGREQLLGLLLGRIHQAFSLGGG